MTTNSTSIEEKAILVTATDEIVVYASNKQASFNLTACGHLKKTKSSSSLKIDRFVGVLPGYLFDSSFTNSEKAAPTKSKDV